VHARQVSTAFLALGLLVGAVAGLGMVVGFEPARLPAALLNIAAYKLAFLAALSLIAAGGVAGRYARSRAVPRAPQLSGDVVGGALGPGASGIQRSEPEPEPVRVARS
jgi:hypothetical protein